MILRALVELWLNETGIYIDRLPGVYASGENEPAALSALPDAVEQHLAWLASHGGFEMPGEALEIEIAERLPAREGRYGPLFESDRVPVSDEDIEQALRVAALGRRDLIDLYRSVSAMRRNSTPADGGWSIAQHLRHVAELDLFYVTAFSSGPWPSLPDDPVQALQTSATFVQQVIHKAARERPADVIEHGGEEWTVAKVLRRVTAHVREHEPWVRRIARS